MYMFHVHVWLWTKTFIYTHTHLLWQGCQNVLRFCEFISLDFSFYQISPGLQWIRMCKTHCPRPLHWSVWCIHTSITSIYDTSLYLRISCLQAFQGLAFNPCTTAAKGFLPQNGKYIPCIKLVSMIYSKRIPFIQSFNTMTFSDLREPLTKLQNCKVFLVNIMSTCWEWKSTRASYLEISCRWGFQGFISGDLRGRLTAPRDRVLPFSMDQYENCQILPSCGTNTHTQPCTHMWNTITNIHFSTFISTKEGSCNMRAVFSVEFCLGWNTFFFSSPNSWSTAKIFPDIYKTLPSVVWMREMENFCPSICLSTFCLIDHGNYFPAVSACINIMHVWLLWNSQTHTS